MSLLIFDLFLISLFWFCSWSLDFWSLLIPSDSISSLFLVSFLFSLFLILLFFLLLCLLSLSCLFVLFNSLCLLFSLPLFFTSSCSLVSRLFLAPLLLSSHSATN
jgi:hypothetical protein